MTDDDDTDVFVSPDDEEDTGEDGLRPKDRGVGGGAAGGGAADKDDAVAGKDLTDDDDTDVFVSPDDEDEVTTIAGRTEPAGGCASGAAAREDLTDKDDAGALKDLTDEDDPDVFVFPDDDDKEVTAISGVRTGGAEEEEEAEDLRTSASPSEALENLAAKFVDELVDASEALETLAAKLMAEVADANGARFAKDEERFSKDGAYAKGALFFKDEAEAPVR